MPKCCLCSNKGRENFFDLLHIQGNRIICTSCYDNYSVGCRNCGNTYLETDVGIDFRSPRNHNNGWYCTNCYSRMNTQLSWRPYKHVVVGNGVGKIVQSARGWSTELEIFVTDLPKVIEEFGKLPNSFGINRDGSLDRSEGNRMPDGRQYVKGMELTTPILKGKEGEQYLINLCNAINKDDNAQVNHTCGTHIHIDMNDLRSNVEALKRILVFHWIYEPVIMSFLPATRRANVYCQSLKNDYHYKRIIAAKNMTELIAVWQKNNAHRNRYDKKHPRYHGINFDCVFHAGHAEVRYHSGTTNAKKVMYWAALHTLIIDYCAGLTGKKVDTATLLSKGLTMTGRPCSLSKLTNQFFEMLDLNEETKTYFINRQKKFKNSKTALEIDFEEKEKMAHEPESHNPQKLDYTIDDEITEIVNQELINVTFDRVAFERMHRTIQNINRYYPN